MLYLPISLFIFIFLLLHNYISFRPHLFLFHPPQFYHLPSSTFLFPPPQFYYFRSSFLKSLPLHNINISPTPPHSFLSSSFTIFIIFPPQSCFPSSSTILLFSLFHLYLLMYSIHFSIHKYIDLLSTLHRPHIDPTSTPHRPHIDPTSTPHRPHIDPTKTRNVFIPSSSYSSTSSSFLLFSLLNVFIPSSFTTTTTSTTFLLFPSTTTTFVGYRNNRFCPDTNPYISNVTQQCRIVIFGA